MATEPRESYSCHDQRLKVVLLIAPVVSSFLGGNLRWRGAGWRDGY
ncbi:hypothetical protein E2C01_095519 [Portunus trituberculatus]|uniref:Uncharacterized protein n=1 Tax=Portunus trituberculatus TaxID=210409 RepID=A0A5B7JT82_PORTR|nr:hypothetical protein [Portunus trituberculatus]